MSTNVVERHNPAMVHSGNPEGEVAPSPQLSEDTEFDKAESLPSSDETRVDSLNGPPAQEAPHSEVERSRGKIVIIMIALGMAVFLAALDITIVTTALPTIAEHFHTASGYTWIGSSYLLAVAASTTIWGKLSDIWGRKPVLLIANFIFFVGSLIAALSVTIGMLITARAIQGLGGGGLVVLVNITIGDLFSPRRRGAYYGVIGGVWAIASSLGPIIGGAFTEKVSWRWCFYVNLPVDGLAFIIIFFFLDLKTPKVPFLEGIKAIDWIGALLVVGATLMFLFGLQLGGESYPWDSATVICLLVFGVVTAALFFLWEFKFAIYPIMPTRLFDSRTAKAAFIVCFCHGAVFIGSSFFLPLYFQASLGATPILSGVYLLPTSLSLSVASIATGIYIRKTGLYVPPIFVGLFLMTLGYGLFIDLRRDSGWAKIIIYQIIAGLGVGPLFQAPLIALQAGINPRDIGTATAAFGFVRNIGTSVSVVVGGVIFQSQVSKHRAVLAAALPPAAVSALTSGSAGASIGIVDALPPAAKRIAQDVYGESLWPMWTFYTVVSAIAFVVALFIKRQNLSREHKETETGLEAEKARRAAVLAEKQEKAARKGQQKGYQMDRLGSSNEGSTTASEAGRSADDRV